MVYVHPWPGMFIVPGMLSPNQGPALLEPQTRIDHLAP